MFLIAINLLLNRFENLLFRCLVIRDSSNNTNMTVYRKSTNNDIYLNWESFALGKWKWGNLKITKNVYDVCSNQELL